MEWSDWFDGFRCSACGKRSQPLDPRCQSCGEPLELVDLATALSNVRPRSTGNGYDGAADLIPFDTGDDIQSSPGATPMILCDWLAETSECGTVFLKNEGANPTGHVADRDMAVAVPLAPHLAISTVALPSPGRSGIAAAAASGAQSLSNRVFVPARATFPSKALINVHGGNMSVVGGRYADAHAAFVDAFEDGWLSLDPNACPFRRFGRVLLYLELLADMDWIAPDVLVVPAARSLDIVPLISTAEACVEAGLVDHIPRFIATQPAGCAPLVDAATTDTASVPDWKNPDTICGELEITHQPGMERVLELIRSTDSEAISVPDPAALEAAVQIARRTGVAPSVAGGVAAAGLTASTTVRSDETAVVLLPGSGGLDADILRSHLMGQGE